APERDRRRLGGGGEARQRAAPGGRRDDRGAARRHAGAALQRDPATSRDDGRPGRARSLRRPERRPREAAAPPRGDRARPRRGSGARALGGRGAGRVIPPKAESFLSAHTRTFLVTVRPDGAPACHPMVGLWRNGALYMNTYRKSA